MILEQFLPLDESAPRYLRDLAKQTGKEGYRRGVKLALNNPIAASRMSAWGLGRAAAANKGKTRQTLKKLGKLTKKVTDPYERKVLIKQLFQK